MKKIFLYILPILILVTLLNYIPTIAQTSNDPKAVISNLEKQYFEALANQDQELMDSLLDDSFVISSMSSNRSMKKKAFLKTLPKQDMTSHDITAIKVDVEGDKANSQVDVSMTKTYDGSDHSGNYEVYSVWVNKDNNWKLVERKIKFLNPSQ
ncbi:MAG: nuclear transport factor 2 family protein [Thermodesulfobacteriota bacterium]